ncbi:hypothetical protein AAIH64_06825, partial [Pseudomonas aeruginosa]|uniref:hypothetical protein n=1 Tax=Pseudomonas aeruginosa TaxID=287 RepID=UPI0031B725BF
MWQGDVRCSSGQVVARDTRATYQDEQAVAAGRQVILGDMPWEVGEPKWGNGLDVQLHPYEYMCFAIGSPNHVH